MVDDVGALVLAGLFLFLALAALTLMASLRRSRDPLLAAFACFVVIFGARLAAGTQSSRDLLGPAFSQAATDVLTYLIPLPILLATAGLITGRWRTLAQGLVIYQLSFVVVAIGVDLACGRPERGGPLYPAQRGGRRFL